MRTVTHCFTSLAWDCPLSGGLFWLCAFTLPACTRPEFQLGGDSPPPTPSAASGPSGWFPRRGILALPVQPASCLVSLKPPQAPPLHSWEASRPPTLHSPSGKITVAHTVSSPSSAESLLCPGFVPLRMLSQLLRGRPEGEHVEMNFSSGKTNVQRPGGGLQTT